MCGAPDVQIRLVARTFILISHLLGSHNKYQKKSARTEAPQRVGSAKQCPKLSPGQNKHGQNITFHYHIIMAYGEFRKYLHIYISILNHV